MKRRQFIRSLALGGLFVGAGSHWWPSMVRADVPVNDRHVLLNITLRGGPDFRHLIVPPVDSAADSFGNAYWLNRWRSHGATIDPASWQQRYDNDYLPVDVGGTRFGVLGKAAWLKQQFDAGNVAIINNVAGSTTRDHSHSLVVYESGDSAAGPNDLTRNGWGGRLASAVDGNVVSMTSRVRLFCNGPHPSNPRSHDNRSVVTASNTREIALYHDPDLQTDPTSRSSRAILSRSLSSYYAAKTDIPEASPYHPIVQHEELFRAFGGLVEDRLATVPLPPAIQALYDSETPLNSTRFGQQMRNVYDSFACSDIFNFRVGSMVYDGFDTHRNQVDAIEPRFEDLFGADGGLATLFAELEQTMPDALDNAVIVIGGEFGRQLAANGDQGTDHGRGNTLLVIGKPVKGGVYGELFPTAEIPRFAESSADILGQTSLEQVLNALCEWVEPASGATVFPDLSKTIIEAGLGLDQLFSV